MLDVTKSEPRDFTVHVFINFTLAVIEVNCIVC